MFLLTQPSDEQIRNIIAAQRNTSFSYPDVGATSGAIPNSYTVDHNRVKLGDGQSAFELAVAAVRRWEMFNLGWVQLCWPDRPLVAGTTVAVLVSLYGL